MAGQQPSVAKASLSLIGTIVGAGIFGLPAVFVRVGYWPGTLLFLLLTGVVLVTHLLYAETCLSTRQKMRLPGFARRELGRGGFAIAALTHPLQIVGANVIYLIMGGQFLASLIAFFFGPIIDPQIFSVALFVVTALVVLAGLRFMAKIESSATWLLIACLFLMALLLLPFSAHPDTLPSHWTLFMLPFGAILFTLSGFPVIGEIVEIAGRDRYKTYLAVIIGTLASAWLSWMFGMGVALASGGKGNLDPAHLMAVLPSAWGWLVPLVGFLAIATSYVTTAQELKCTLRFDFMFRRETAWIAAMVIPLLLFFIIPLDTVSLIAWVGAIFGSINGILIAAISHRILRRDPQGKHYLIALGFFAAVAYSVGLMLVLLLPRL